MSKEWINRTNVYEVNVRQYTKEGTFVAFKKHLPRLHEMGVETLWFMPITPIAQKHKKGSMGSPYACSDYTSVNPELGKLQDFKELVAAAQSAGFKVIIDWVANHTGWDHVWTVSNPDYYQQDEATGTFKTASGMDDIIELDFSNASMRHALIQAMMYWVRECGIDGFRCDLAFWVPLSFWKEAKAALDPVKTLFWLGELDPLDNPDYMQVFDAAYTWTWMHQTESFYKQSLPPAHLKSILERYRSAPGIKAWFTSNHDENTWNGTEYEKYGAAAPALAVLSCTWPGIPLIYSGQELPNHKRLAFFEKDPIDWQRQPELETFYQTLLRLHSDHPALSSPTDVTIVQTTADESVLAYLRKQGEHELMVILNLTASNVNCYVYNEYISGSYHDAFTGGEVVLRDQLLELAPWGYLVLEGRG